MKSTTWFARMMSVSIMAIAAQSAAAQVHLGVSDDPGNFADFDKTIAAPNDGIVRYRGVFQGVPTGATIDFDLFYGNGLPSGITGVTSALNYITITNLIVQGDSSQVLHGLGPMYVSFSLDGFWPSGSSVGVVLDGELVDFGNDGSISTGVLASGNLAGGFSTDIRVNWDNPTTFNVAPGGSVPFSLSSVSGPTNSDITALGLNLHFMTIMDDGFVLPMSLHVIALGEGYTFDPQIVPEPASLSLLGLLVLAAGARRPRRS